MGVDPEILPVALEGVQVGDHRVLDVVRQVHELRAGRRGLGGGDDGLEVGVARAPGVVEGLDVVVAPTQVLPQLALGLGVEIRQVGARAVLGHARLVVELEGHDLVGGDHGREQGGQGLEPAPGQAQELGMVEEDLLVVGSGGRPHAGLGVAIAQPEGDAEALVLGVDVGAGLDDDRQLQPAAQVQEAAQVALGGGAAVEVELSLVHLVPDPGHVGGDQVDARFLEGGEHAFPLIPLDAKILELAAEHEIGPVVDEDPAGADAHGQRENLLVIARPIIGGAREPRHDAPGASPWR
ncbi:hypothetical protein D3C86_1135170 [compost metagenome]